MRVFRYLNPVNFFNQRLPYFHYSTGSTDLLTLFTTIPKGTFQRRNKELAGLEKIPSFLGKQEKEVIYS